MSQLVLPLELRPAQGRADFIVVPGNREAVAFIDSWPGWPAPAVALYGPRVGQVAPGGGMGGAGRARVIAASDLRGPAPDGPLVVENAQTLASETALFALMERGSPLLLTAESPPAEWPVALPDLVSRLRALLGFALWAPDDVLLEALAAKLFADRQLQVPDAVIAHMIARLERSPAAIRDFVGRADARALAEKRPVNLGLIRDLLAETPPAS